MGRRIFKKVYSGETLEKHLSFVYDGYKLIEERNALANNAAVRNYVWQPEALDRDVPLTVYDVASEKTYYYHTDANKNVTELSDENGGIVAHYEYSPFGSLTKVSGDYADSNPFRFSSEYFDEETGLIYYNYRYYNPELGRWISRDPIEEQGGYNLYGMIGNNLLNNWDSLGQIKWHKCWDKFKEWFNENFWDIFDTAKDAADKAKELNEKKEKAEEIAKEKDPKVKLDKSMHHIEDELDGTIREGEKIKPQAGRSDSVKSTLDKISERNQRINDAIFNDKF